MRYALAHCDQRLNSSAIPNSAEIHQRPFAL